MAETLKTGGAYPQGMPEKAVSRPIGAFSAPGIGTYTESNENALDADCSNGGYKENLEPPLIRSYLGPEICEIWHRIAHLVADSNQAPMDVHEMRVAVETRKMMLTVVDWGKDIYCMFWMLPEVKPGEKKVAWIPLVCGKHLVKGSKLLMDFMTPWWRSHGIEQLQGWIGEDRKAARGRIWNPLGTTFLGSIVALDLEVKDGK